MQRIAEAVDNINIDNIDKDNINIDNINIDNISKRNKKMEGTNKSKFCSLAL